VDGISAQDEQTATQSRRHRGHALLRLVVLPVGCVLLIGAAAYTASIALSPDKPVVATMCFDSTCSFGMAAGSDMSSMPAPSGSSASPMTMSGSMQTRPIKQHRSPPERFVRGALHFFHMR
jgi:hypothetical protein